MKLTKLFAFVAVAIMAVGCYEKFETPAPRPIMNDESFESKFPEAKYITIAELKGMFIDECGNNNSLSGTGNNDAWSNTKYLLIEDDLYIKGKVISDDEDGNIYKSLHIQDHTSGIELKLNNNVGLRYKYGSWVYVRLKGLYLGSYRMMLSLGAEPSESYNKLGKHKFYANSNIELQEIVDRHVFAGEQDAINVGTYEQWLSDPKMVDVITVTEDNYKEVFKPANISVDNGMGGKRTMKQRELMFGRLTRFEGLTCRYAGVPNQDGEVNPVIMNGSYSNIYPSWLYTDVDPSVQKGWYHWAFKEEITGRSLYGSVLFAYDLDEKIASCGGVNEGEENKWYCSLDGLYVLRSSGYSRFARRNMCKDGAVATITAIYGIYSKQSDYAADADDWATYQLTISNYSDIEFASDDALLTDEQVRAMTTDDMKSVPWIDEEGEVDVM